MSGPNQEINTKTKLPKAIAENTVTKESAKNFAEEYSKLATKLSEEKKATITISTKAVRDESGKHTNYIGGTELQRNKQIAAFESSAQAQQWPLVKALFHLRNDNLKNDFKIEPPTTNYEGGKPVSSNIVTIGKPEDNHYRIIKVNMDTGEYSSLTQVSPSLRRAIQNR